MHLTKRIPIGGGLGGGSSDAAAILRWARCSDPAIALGLGSDVPFSVVGGRALVEGIGEVVTPLEYERRDFVLLIPPFGVTTALVYAAYDAPNHKGHSTDESSARNDLTDAALAVEPRWPDGATCSATSRGVNRCWREAAPPGSSKAGSIPKVGLRRAL